jgi:hypothetical protein
VLVLLVGILVAALSAPGVAKSKRKPSYAGDLEAFVKEVDKSYPFFDLKKIRKQWKASKKDFMKRAKACKSDDEFILLVWDAVKVLRDAHIQVKVKSGKYPTVEKEYLPGISFLPASEDRVIVMHPPRGRESTLPSGTVVTKIDGKPARKVLDDQAAAEWEAGGWFSSPQRARLFVYRTPLCGKKGESVTLSYLDGKKEKTVKLRRELEPSGWPHTYHLPKDLKSHGRSFYYSQLESGVGYMYWRRIDESIWTGIPKALAAFPETKGWIVDIRGNAGGGYDAELVGLIKNLPRPVAAIMDAGCISAGETVARDLVKLADARLFGTKTAGSSTSKRMWEFPSGIASIRFSTRSRYGPDGKPIEFNGVAPHEVVEPDPEEVLAGKNSEILRAEEWVLDPKQQRGRKK